MAGTKENEVKLKEREGKKWIGIVSRRRELLRLSIGHWCLRHVILVMVSTIQHDIDRCCRYEKINVSMYSPML